MEALVRKLQTDFPAFTFRAGPRFRWAADHQEIIYKLDNDIRNTWGILHELGHALRGHHDYHTDVELLRKEVEAWAEAESLSAQYGVTIDAEHIQGCLDSYRDWLHKRSTCPQCALRGVQDDAKRYVCLNCKATWVVSSARFCRAYRRSQAT